MNPENTIGFHIYKSSNKDGSPERTFLSPLSPEDVERAGGLASEAVIGELTDDSQRATPENFTPNPAFVKFLQKLLAVHAHVCPDLMAEAQRGGTGRLTVVDRRVQRPPGAQHDLKDILGWIEVKEGRLMRFSMNPGHQLVTRDGLTVLNSWYQDRLLEELRKLTPSPPAAPPIQ